MLRGEEPPNDYRASATPDGVSRSASAWRIGPQRLDAGGAPGREQCCQPALADGSHVRCTMATLSGIQDDGPLTAIGVLMSSARLPVTVGASPWGDFQHDWQNRTRHAAGSWTTGVRSRWSTWSHRVGRRLGIGPKSFVRQEAGHAGG